MSIKFIDGDLLQDDAEILVNPVNCCGVMGAGVAKVFKERYPKMFSVYRNECKRGWLKPGFVYKYKVGKNKWVCNATTKDGWKNPSNYQWVENCLIHICTMLLIRIEVDGINVPTIAMPALGCGNGGLNFGSVKKLIIKNLAEVADLCDIRVYNPR